MLKQFNIGKSGEHLVKKIFNDAGFFCELNNDYATRYDNDLFVEINDVKFTIECKYDIMSVKTGNIAIEYHNCKSDCPSGIYSTLADVWVHLIPNKDDDSILAYAISVDKLKHFVETATPLKTTSRSGDKNSNLKIFKKDDILKEFVRFDNVVHHAVLESIFTQVLEQRV